VLKTQKTGRVFFLKEKSGVGKEREESSFSEEKEAKRL
jgi:hypothetical protein